MQLDTNFGKAVWRIGENIVIENHEGMRHFGTCHTQCFYKIQLTAAICCQIFDQQNALAIFDITLYTRITAKSCRNSLLFVLLS